MIETGRNTNDTKSGRNMNDTTWKKYECIFFYEDKKCCVSTVGKRGIINWWKFFYL